MAFVSSCVNHRTDMKKIDQYWDRLIHAGDEMEEQRSIEQFSQYLKDNDISFTVFWNRNGNLVDLQKADPQDSVYPVSIRFQKIGDGAGFIKENWKPRNPQAPFYFYRE